MILLLKLVAAGLGPNGVVSASLCPKPERVAGEA